MPRSGELVPEFSAGFPDNVTVQRESAAFLDCPVKNPGDRPVSYPLVNIRAGQIAIFRPFAMGNKYESLTTIRRMSA